ncbi:MAG: N-acetylmuramoyl-L-alanine amidase [Clostridia bacterium]|nr:N-acetylmuramoyl-L-alanine amidase [Clostridia bacterium]
MYENLVPDSTFYLNGVKVRKYILGDHNENGIALPQKNIGELKGVTIHNTNDLAGVRDSAQRYTQATLDGDMNDVRVHFYVDDLGAWQNLETDSVSWHAADGADGPGNTQTISIECIMSSEDDPVSLKSRDNAARLAAYLLYANGLDENDLYTHTYWLNVRDGIEGTTDYLNTLQNPYKYCPEFLLPDWYSFKNQVAQYIEQLKTYGGGAFAPYSVEVTADVLNVRSGPGTQYPVNAQILRGEVYTLINTLEVNGEEWGELLSGTGWIDLKYTRRVQTV